jgi:predicted MFS family arabinose efflux permease
LTTHHRAPGVHASSSLRSGVAAVYGGVVRGERKRFADAVGGRGRRRAVFVLAAVLSVSSADSGTIGALAPQMETAFHIGNTQIGLLVTVTSLVGALAALPMGALADRARRMRVLAVTVGLWSLAMVATGLSTDFTMLLLTRLALGVVTAASGPIVASLLGDLFPPGERSQIYGYVLTGELLGAGAGLVIAGNAGAAVSWRAAFFILAMPSLALGLLAQRLLPEPARGGQSRLRPGDGAFRSGPDGANAARCLDDGAGVSEGDSSAVRRQASERHDVRADSTLVLHRDPTGMSAWSAGWYVLRIPTNRLLIAASALSYFFLAGLQTFAILFAEAHFRLSHGVVTVLLVVVGGGAVIGTVTGGRVADALIRRGRADARLVLAGEAFLALAAFLLAGLATTTVVLALPIFFVGGAVLGSTNPALDAARLDIVPSRLWGRAESVRTFVRTLAEAFAPLLFGFVSAALSGGRSPGLAGGVNTAHQHISAAQGRGLEYTFMIMLVPLAASGVVLLASRRRYLQDVATAEASEGAPVPQESCNPPQAPPVR